MSQPPKSTIRAPAARCNSLSGVILGKFATRKKIEKGSGKRWRLPDPSVLLPERLAPSVDGLAVALQNPESSPGPNGPFCLRVCGGYPFGAPAATALQRLPIG